MSVTEATGIRPFQIEVSDEQLAELRRRITATNWPEKETVADQSQGVPLALTQELARYWATDYDWRKVEARLKALPRSTGLTSTSFTFGRSMMTPCPSSSTTDGPGRSSSS